MAAPVVVACTHCDAQLKLKDDSFSGKKLKCPKCGQVFVVPGGGTAAGKSAAAKKPAKPKGEVDFSNISEDHYEPPPPPEGEESEEYEEPAALPQSPLMKKQAAAKGGKKKKKRASSGPGLGHVAAIAGLVLLGAGIVGGVGYGIFTLISGMGGGGGRFAWMPEDAEWVVEIRPAEVWSAPVLAPVVSGPLGEQLRQRMLSNAALQAGDIDRLVIGGAIGEPAPVIVMYATADIDQQKAAGDWAAAEHGGQAIFTKAGNTAVFHDARTMIVGPDAKVRAAIDRGGICPVADKFAALPTGRQIAFLTTRLQTPSGTVPAGLSAQDIDPERVNSLAVGVTLSSDIALELACDCKTAEDAAQLRTSLNTGREQGLSQIQAQKSQLTPNPFIDVTKMQALLTSLESALQSYQPAVSGTTVSGELTLPGSMVQDASEMLAAFAPMMQGLGDPSPPPAAVTPTSESEAPEGEESPAGETP